MQNTEQMKRDYDPITVEIHRKALDNIANEMALTLIRTSGSPVVTQARDFCTCLLDRDGEPLSFAAYVLLHAAGSMIGAKTLIAQLRETGQKPRPGDGWVVNDPYHGGAMHQADISIITPAFYNGELVGWSYVNCHVLDVGGVGISGFAPGARSVYEEGLRIPLLRLISRGVLDTEWEQYIRANVRVPDLVINDIRSMIASNNVAQAKLTELIDRFGMECHAAYCRINQDLSERLFRERIAALPDGIYESREWSEYDGHGVAELYEVGCTLTIAGDELRFAFAGAPQVAGPINASIGGAYGQIISVILTTLCYGDLPYNAGIWRAMTIDLGPPGTIVNAAPPAPVSFSHAGTAIRIGRLTKDVLNQALALSSDPALRNRLAGLPNDGSTMANLFGVNQAGHPCVMFHVDPTISGGGGGRNGADGMDFFGLTCMAAGGITDIEVHEANDPVLFLWRRLAPNTGGPGQFRGGQGSDTAYEVRYTETLSGNVTTLIAELPHRGVAGGLPGSVSGTIHWTETNLAAIMQGGRQPLPKNLAGTRLHARSYDGAFTIGRGEIVHHLVGGGGGFGDPLLREPERIAADIADGYITPEHAQAIYAVAFGPDGRVDARATEAARRERRCERVGGPPARQGRPPATPGVTVTLAGDAENPSWACGCCAAPLCQSDANWRLADAVVRHENDAAARLGTLGTPLRKRKSGPLVTLREYYCKECASALAVETAPLGYEFPVPRLIRQWPGGSPPTKPMAGAEGSAHLSLSQPEEKE